MLFRQFVVDDLGCASYLIGCEDGQELPVGNVRLRVVHLTRADEPWLLLTGDSLFVGDAARPDLAVEARAGAEGLCHSLRRLLELPDGVEVYPGHVAGSLCGKGMSSKASTTIGFERRFNQALARSTVEAFIADSASVSTPRPPNTELIVELNRGPFLGSHHLPIAKGTKRLRISRATVLVTGDGFPACVQVGTLVPPEGEAGRGWGRQRLRGVRSGAGRRSPSCASSAAAPRSAPRRVCRASARSRSR